MLPAQRPFEKLPKLRLPHQLGPFHTQVTALMWLLARKINQVNSSLIKGRQGLIVNFLSLALGSIQHLLMPIPRADQGIPDPIRLPLGDPSTFF